MAGETAPASPRWRRLLRGPRNEQLAMTPAEPSAGNDAAIPAAATAQTGLALEACELIEVAAGEALLRVSGRWSPAAPGNIELLVSHGEAIAVLRPVPPGPIVSEQ